MMMSLLAIILAGCLVALAGNTEHIDIYVVISISIFTGALFYDTQKISTYKKYWLPILLGYIFRIFLLFYDVYTNNPLALPLVGGELKSDPLRFFNAAIGYSQGISTSYGGLFPRLLGAIFSLTGISRLWAEFIVVIFSMLTIIVFVDIVDELDITIAYRKIGVYLICLLPNFAFLSVVLRRESIITFFVALSVKYFVRWFREGVNKAFVLAFVYALGASLFHGATGLIVLSYIFVRMVYSPKKNRYVIDIKNTLIAISFLVLFLFIYARYGTVFFSKVENSLSANVYSSTRDAGGSSYAQYVGDASTPLRMIIYAVPRFLYFMFSPFPWQWRGAGDVITFLLSSSVYLFIIVRSIRYIRRSEKDDENRNIIIALLLVALLSAAVFSWGVTNTGTATRHRDKFIVIYSLLISLSQSTHLRVRLRNINYRNQEY